MTPRLYLEPPCPASHTLDARRSHHLVRVLRIRDGDSIELFDGTGAVWSAQVTCAEARGCRIERGRRIALVAPPSPEIHLAQALLKNDAMDRLLRQATELGVAHIWPLASERTQSRERGAMARSHHWRRIIIAACEQSRRAHLPRLHDLRRFADFIGAAPPGRALLLHPGAQAMPRELPIASTTILIGPEGGWTDEEAHQAARLGIDAFGLGDWVLRAETAPLAALAAVRHGWGWR